MTMDYTAKLARLIRGPSSRSFDGLTVALELEGSTLLLAAVEKGESSRAPGSRTNLLDSKSIAFHELPEIVAPLNEFIRACLDKATSAEAKRQPIEAIRLIVSFPRSQAIVRILELPSVDPRELKDMARLQALAGLPFQEEELVSDITVLSRDAKTGHSKVLLVIVRKSALAPYLELFESLGRWPHGFVLDTVGTDEFLRRRKESVPSNYLHLRLKDGWLNVEVFKDGILASSRGIPFGPKGLGPERVIQECQQSLAAADLRELQKIVVTRQAPGAEQDLELALEKELGAPVESRSDRAPDAPSASLSVTGAAHADLAAALMLLPPEILERQSRQSARRGVASAAAWLGIWLAVGAGIGGGRLLRTEWRLSVLDAELKKLQPEAVKVSDTLEQAALLRSQADEGAAPLDILRELYRAAPQGVTLRTIARSPDGGVMIQGSAPRLSVVMDYVSGLQRSPLFSQIELHGSSLRNVQNVDSVDFQIQGEIKGAARSGRAASKRRRA